MTELLLTILIFPGDKILYKIAYSSIFALSLFTLIPRSFATATPESITLHYIDRPPYAISQNETQPIGVVADPAEKAFKKAKIPFVWAKTPVNRQFAIIKENKGLDCAIGLEQTPSRQEFAKFTEPVYISAPLVAIVNKSRVKEKKGITLVQMLAKYSILVKENYTLGDEITALVNRSPSRNLTSVESSQMVQMIALGHADFMMISSDEVAYYLKHGILNGNAIRIMNFPDVQKRFTRRIMCSKAVDDKTIAKLDKAIEHLEVSMK